MLIFHDGIDHFWGTEAVASPALAGHADGDTSSPPPARRLAAAPDNPSLPVHAAFSTPPPFGTGCASAPCPVDGSTCALGLCRGGKLIKNLEGWNKHGRAHFARELAAAAKAASLTVAASVDLTDAQLKSVPATPLPREALEGLSAVELETTLAPGQRTVQYIPRPLRPIAFSAFSTALSHCTDSPTVTIAASKVLATIAFFGLGVDEAAVAIPEGETGVPTATRKARVEALSRQLGLLAHGRFSQAATIAADRAERERAAAARAAPPAPDKDGATLTSGVLSPSTIRAVHMHNANGNHGKAVNRLIPAPSAAFCDSTFKTIDRLHPQARHPIPDELLSVEVEPVVATLDTVVAVLGKLRRGVAAGVSGLTNDHLLSLFPVDTEAERAALGPLLKFVNMVLAAKVDEATADWLCASVLVTLYKPDGEGGLKRRDDGELDVRPIAIPETLYSLVALCGLHLCKDAIAAKLASIKQLGVGVSSGPEAIATAARLFVNEVANGADNDEASDRLINVVLACDASNAFNTVDRGAVLRMVKEVCPGLLPFVRMSYKRDGRLNLANRGSGDERFRIFLSRTGVRQGDPLGPVLFALAAMEAMRNTQKDCPNVPLLSLADDVNGLIRAPYQPDHRWCDQPQ